MGVAPPQAHSMQMVGPWGRYLPKWLRAPGTRSGPAICQHILGPRTSPTIRSRGPIRYASRLCIPHTHKHASTHTHTHKHTHTHTHTEDLTHHNVCFRGLILYTCQLCTPNTHMHAGPYTYTLYTSQKHTQ